MDLAHYAAPGPLTTLTPAQAIASRGLSKDPLELCRVVQTLVVSPTEAAAAGVPATRMNEINLRPASELLQRATDLDPATPLGRPRPAENRVVGTCRHFAVLATAFLRASGTPTRARCGFATYFIPPRNVDHWIIEYWHESNQQWTRIDPEYADRTTPAASRPNDLQPGEFLTAVEAWQLLRSGQAEGATFGVFGTENWGPGEVRGNAMRDLASMVAKIEMLPWDEWGPMQDSYNNKTGDSFDELIDDLAAAIDAEDDRSMQSIYDQLAVPATLVSTVL